MGIWRTIIPAHRPVFWAATVLLVAWATAGSAHLSEHDAVDLVWHADASTCVDVPMTLIDDYVWDCLLPVSETGLDYFQFWPGGALDPKYGADVLTPGGLVYDEDPSLVPENFSLPGCYRVVLFEAELRYEIEGAPGAILIQASFSDDPPAPPADLAVTVTDVLYGDALGTWTPDGGAEIAISNLCVGRDYELTVTAGGYAAQTLTVAVPGLDPVTEPVTLVRLVAAETRSWSEIKALYRR